MFGSDGYTGPQSRLSALDVELPPLKAPVVFPTKREAVASFERYPARHQCATGSATKRTSAQWPSAATIDDAAHQGNGNGIRRRVRALLDRRATARKSGALDAQANSITRYCEAHGLTLGRIYTDGGVSGGTPLAQRPEGRALIEAIGQA